MTRTDTPEQALDPPAVRQPRLGPVGWARFAWRRLTSMRTALMLLLLLAVAAVPGSIWPQRSIDPVRVKQYLDDNPGTGPWLDRLGLFDVFSSPWFAAIYLLLMVSLVGCLVPRTMQQWHALRAAPPRTPRHLGRLPVHRHTVVEATEQETLQAARQVLRRRRFRLRADDPAAPDAISAEGGYLKETGNLVFHFSLLGVIVSVALGHLMGWRGEVILPEGDTFTSSVSRYNTIQAGPWVDQDDISPFALTLQQLDVTFETVAGGVQFGAPRTFEGTVRTTAAPGQTPRTEQIAVNHPLDFDGTSVYLLGNGYAPVVTVRDGQGQVVYSQPTPFLPRDGNYSSAGAVKVPGTDPELGFYGAFLPTVRFDPAVGPTSDFPGLVDPALVLDVYQGTLFPGGRAQSVYTLDVSAMTQVQAEGGEPLRVVLRPGETRQLPGGMGSITLDRVVRWAGLVARHDPGRVPLLICAGVLLAGLVAMLVVRRRRVFVRVSGAPPGSGRHTEVSVAGLAKGSDPGLDRLVAGLLDQIREQLGEPVPDQEDDPDGTDPAGQDELDGLPGTAHVMEDRR